MDFNTEQIAKPDGCLSLPALSRVCGGVDKQMLSHAPQELVLRFGPLGITSGQRLADDHFQHVQPGAHDFVVGSVQGFPSRKASRSHCIGGESSFGAVGSGHTPKAARDLGFGLIRQGFAPSGARCPLSRTDAGHGERLPARHPRDEINPDHLAARRGLSLSVHGLSIGQRQSSVTLQAKGYAQ